MTSSPRQATTTIEQLGLIDRVCLEFENGLRAGRSPDLCMAVKSMDDEFGESLLQELLLLESSYLPSEVLLPRLNNYRQNLPQLSQVIDSVFPQTRARHIAGQYPEPGQILGNYRVVKELGHGSFGRVFEAICIADGHKVALKMAGHEATSAESVRILREEAAILSRLNHPAILSPKDIWESDFGPVLVFPLASCGTLRQDFRQGERKPATMIARLIPVIRAIEHAHIQGVVHRDIEPDNILVRESGDLVLSDFGLAIHETSQAGSAGQSAGSLAYMSPEQVRGESHWLDGRADIWAIGVILYESLTGRRPFLSVDPDQLIDEILCRPVKPLRQIDNSIPVELEQICLRCLSRVTSHRYSTAGDLADDLEDWLTQNSRRHRPVRKRTAVITSALGVIVAVAVAAFLFRGDSDRQTNLENRANTNRPPEQIHSGVRTASVSTAQLSAQPTDLTVNASEPQLRFDVTVVRRDPADGSATPGLAYDIRAADILPLRPGDQFWIDISFPRHQHAAAFLVDVHGTVHPLEILANRAATDQPFQNASIPAANGEQTKFDVLPGESGTEAIVLITSENALDTQQAATVFPTLDDQSDMVFTLPAFYRNGNRDVRGTSELSKTGLAGAVRNQKRIWEAFRAHECGVHAVLYGFRDSD